MRRACYCRKPEGYEILHLKAIRKDGTIETEPIENISQTIYGDLTQAVLKVNRMGYGIIGDIEDIRRENNHRIYVKKCGDNLMDIDDL